MRSLYAFPLADDAIPCRRCHTVPVVDHKLGAVRHDPDNQATITCEFVHAYFNNIASWNDAMKGPLIDLQRSASIEWLWNTFGEVNPHILEDVEERGLRFGEESLELIQSLGITREQALGLVKQVFDKPKGEPMQELGGTTVTLAALCAVAPGLNPDRAFKEEFARVHSAEVQAKIREKHATKAVVSARSLDAPTRNFTCMAEPINNGSASCDAPFF